MHVSNVEKFKLWCFCSRKVTTSYLVWDTNCPHWGLVWLFQSLQANALMMPRIRPLFCPLQPLQANEFLMAQIRLLLWFSAVPPGSFMPWCCLNLENLCTLQSLKANSCMMRQIRPLMCPSAVPFRLIPGWCLKLDHFFFPFSVHPG